MAVGARRALARSARKTIHERIVTILAGIDAN